MIGFGLFLIAMTSTINLSPIPQWDRFYGDLLTSSEKKKAAEYQALSSPFIFDWYSELKIKIYPNNDLGRALYISGTYEPNSLIIVQKLLSENCVFFDIGAHVGIFSLFASRCVCENGKIIAFEPSSRERHLLSENVELNKLKNIQIEKHAISKIAGFGKLNLAIAKHNGQNTLCEKFAYEGVDSGTVEPVTMTTIDQYVLDHKIQRLDLIKMDIECAEYEALQGATRTLTTLQPALIFEVVKDALKKNGVNVLEMEKFIRDFGYDIFLIDDTANLIPCTLNDIPAGNAVALPKRSVLKMNSKKTPRESAS